MSTGTVELCAVGDISPGDHFLLPGCGIRSTFLAEKPDFLFRCIRDALQADIVFGNLEGVLSNHGFRPGDIASSAFRGVPEMAAALREAGFTTLNLANNHTLQHGEEIFRETAEAIRTSGMIPLGLAGENGEMIPCRLEVAGMRFAFLATSWLPEVYRPELSLYARAGFARTAGQIAALAGEADHVIVSVHHGLEGVDRPSPYKAMLFRRLIDAGARVVLGHHSHVFQAVEEYGRGIICHSLGNFIFDLPWHEALTSGAAVRLRFQRDKVEASCIPFCLNERFQPVLLSGTEKLAALRRIKNLSAGAAAEDLEKASSSYYLAVRAAERDLQRRKILFLLRTFFHGDWPLRMRFVGRKIRERVLSCLPS